MIKANEFYHIYNQGNNREKVFYDDGNYDYFLNKSVRHLNPYCDILAYCLMPNHFHFLVYTKESAAQVAKIGVLEMPQLAAGIKNLQSTYTKGINKQQNRTGSLFRQKAKLKLVENGDGNYPLIAFHYIHQNPMKAGLVKKMEGWKYSSFNEYWKQEDGICNRELAFELIDFGNENFYEQSYDVIY